MEPRPLMDSKDIKHNMLCREFKWGGGGRPRLSLFSFSHN